MEPLVTPAHRHMPVEVLQARIRQACGTFDVEPCGRTGVVAGAVNVRRVGHFDTAIVAIEAGKVHRNARAIRQDPGEHLFLLVQDAGCCRVEQGAHTAVLDPGDMFIVDSVRQSAFHYDGAASSQISFHLPRQEMVHRFGVVCTEGVAIDRGDALWLALRTVIAKLIKESGTQTHLSQALLSLLGAYFQSVRGVNTSWLSETLLSRALALIDKRCTDPWFGPRDLAGLLNISERTLQRHFKPLQETPGQRLLHSRLAMAHGRLSDASTARAESIASIAYASGFNDLSNFYHEFRDKYSTTPGSVLRNH